MSVAPRDALRKFLNELSNFVDKYVIVKLTNGQVYEGTLLGMDIGSESSRFHVLLSNARDKNNNLYYRILINGDLISEIILKTPLLFEPSEFATYLRDKLRLPEGSIRVVPEANAIIVFEKYKVSENGVEGSGPLASKIYSVLQEYLESKKKGLK